MSLLDAPHGYHRPVTFPISLTPEQIAVVARRFVAIRWSWSAAEIDRVLAELGWSRIKEDGPRRPSVLARTGLPTGAATVMCSGDVALSIGLAVTRAAEGADSAVTAVRRDALYTASNAVTSVAGDPAERRPGARPEVRWLVSSGTVRVRDDGDRVELALLSALYAAEPAEPPAEWDGDEDGERP